MTALFTLLLAFAAPAESTITNFTLPNGMRWIVAPSPAAGETTLLLYIDAGSAQESAGSTGLVHTLGEMWRAEAPALTQAGAKRAQVLANQDRVLFRSTWLTAQAETWFRTHAALLRSPELSRFEGARTKALARREMMRKNGPLLDDFVATAFQIHPYRVPQFGFPGDLDRLGKDAAAAFLNSHFVPANAIGVATGEADPAVIRALAEKHFGSLAARPAPEPLRAVEPPQASERRVVVHGAAMQAVVVGYRSVAISDPEAPVYGLLRTLAGRRLKARLTVHEKLAARVDVGPYPAMKYPFLMMVLCFLQPGVQSATAEGIIHEELEKLAATPVPPEEFETVRSAGADEVGKLAPLELATELADWQAMSGTWRSLFRYPEQTAAVTPAQVQALARRLFLPNSRTVGLTQ